MNKKVKKVSLYTEFLGTEDIVGSASWFVSLGQWQLEDALRHLVGRELWHGRHCLLLSSCKRLNRYPWRELKPKSVLQGHYRKRISIQNSFCHPRDYVHL